jgi:hypothetical protein
MVNIQPGPISGAAARKAAQVELRRSEYHRDDPNVISRALDWIGDRLDSVVSGSPTGSATLILLILLGGLIAFAVIRAGRPRRQARLAATTTDPLAPDGQVDHARRAAEFEQQGQWADALREWLRAAIATIEARGVLDPRPGRTGAALAREAGAAMPAVAEPLNAAVDAFEAVWFGRRPATAADVVSARQVAQAVHDARLAALRR